MSLSVLPFLGSMTSSMLGTGVGSSMSLVRSSSGSSFWCPCLLLCEHKHKCCSDLWFWNGFKSVLGDLTAHGKLWHLCLQLLVKCVPQNVVATVLQIPVLYADRHTAMSHRVQVWETNRTLAGLLMFLYNRHNIKMCSLMVQSHLSHIFVVISCWALLPSRFNKWN